MRTRLKVLPLIIGGAFAIAMYGCQERISADAVGDEETLRGLVEELGDWFAVDGHFGEESEDPPGKDEIPSKFWYREVDRPIPRRIAIDVAGDSGFAMIEADIHGWFNILVDVDPDSLIHILILFLRDLEKTNSR